jgi:hypothetical protein
MLQLRADGIDDRLRIVPEQDCAHAEVVVDQPVAVGIDEMCAFALLHDQRRRGNAGPEVGVDTAGHMAARGLHARGRLVEIHGHGCILRRKVRHCGLQGGSSGKIGRRKRL